MTNADLLECVAYLCLEQKKMQAEVERLEGFESMFEWLDKNIVMVDCWLECRQKADAMQQRTIRKMDGTPSLLDIVTEGREAQSALAGQARRAEVLAAKRGES